MNTRTIRSVIVPISIVIKHIKWKVKDAKNMIINPILPIWLMVIICVIMLFFKRKGIYANLRQILIIVLVFVINLRIMVPDDNINTSSSNMDISVLFVVDNTISMLAQDYNGNTERLDAVKADCAYIMEKLQGADFSVITFDNTARIVAPFSSDSDFAKTAIDSIYPIDPLYAKGSSMNICTEVLVDLLKQRKEKNSGALAVFFISDGENNTDEKLQSFEEVASYVDYGAVLGYGTEEGGKMYVRRFYEEGTERTLLQDETDFPYKDAISRIDESNLKKLASDMKISYVNMSEQKNVDDIIKGIKKKAVTTIKDGDKTDGYQDIYYWFVIPLLLLLIYDFKVCIQRNIG